MSKLTLNKLLKKKYQGLTNIKLGQNLIKYSTMECVPNVTQGSLTKAFEGFEFQEGYRYWLSAFYRFGRRGGESFDGNNFSSETSLYNIAREYKNANNANNESIRYVTVYSVKLPGSAGGTDDNHNDCFFNSLVSILGGDNKRLPKIINTAKKLKDYVKLRRDDIICNLEIEEIEKAFPENTSINVVGIIPYNSKRVHATLNFQLKNENEHFTPLCNEGKSKRNIISKLYEFEEERTVSQVYACFIDGETVQVYNGEHRELAYIDFIKLLNDNIILTKNLKTNERLQGKDDLQKCYDSYIKMALSVKTDTKNKINLFKFTSMNYCIMDAMRFFSKNATIPEPMDATEQFWNNMAYSGGHIFGTQYVGDASCYDINSAYSAILYSTCKIPLVKGHLENVKNEDIKKGEDGYYFYDFGIYRANVELDKSKRKFFKHKGKNVYYTHHDLNTAVRCGLKVEIIQDKEPNAYLYDKTKLVNADRVFKEFVEYFYKLKVSGNKYAKMFLNNLSGLMGKKKKVYKRATKKSILEVNDIDYNLIDIDHNHEQDTTTGIMTDIDRIFCSNYARVAIFMTAKARESLCKTIRQIEAVYPDSVLRTHTDSVIVKAGTDVTKVKGFAIGSGIGEWKVETKKDKDGNEVRCEGKCEIISSMEVYWHGAEKKKRKNDI